MELFLIGSPAKQERDLYRSFSARALDHSVLNRSNEGSAVLWFGSCVSWSGVLIWLKKRIHYPRLNLFLVRNPGNISRAEWAVCRALVRYGLADGIIAWQPTNTAAKSELTDRFTLFSSAIDETLDWIRQRVRARARSILLVDPSVSRQSPSLRSVVDSVPELVRLGWELDQWCLESDIKPLCARSIIFPGARFRPGFAKLFAFFILINQFAFWLRLVAGRRPATIVYTTNANLVEADVCAVHFCTRYWIRIARSLRPLEWRDRLDLIIARIGATFERWQLTSRSLRLLLPVSVGIGEVVQQIYGNRVPQRVLPNDYEPKRFNPSVRQQWRKATRDLLGYENDSFVLAFTSYGHYRRKGFWLAVDGLKLLHERGLDHVRLLVIGGTPTAIRELKRKLHRCWADGKRFVLFAGMQTTVERFLAAADAFLFPSFFEAAARAPVEAAAMGLPIFVSDLFGTENLIDGTFLGARVKLSAVSIADRVQSFLRGEGKKNPVVLPAALTSPEYASALADVFDKLLGGGGS